jgi:hypothetical protein
MSMDHFNDYLEKRLFLYQQEQKAYKKQNNRLSGAPSSGNSVAKKRGERPNSVSSSSEIERSRGEKREALAQHVDNNAKASDGGKLSRGSGAMPSPKMMSSPSTEKVRSISSSSTATASSSAGSSKGFSTGQTAPRSQPRMNATEILSPQKQQLMQQQQKQQAAEQVKLQQLQLAKQNAEKLSGSDSSVEWCDEAEQMTKKIQKTVVFLKSEADKIKHALEGLGSTTTIGDVIAIAKAMKEVVQATDEAKQKYPVQPSAPFEVDATCDQVTNLKLSTLYAVGEVEVLLFNYLKIVSKRVYVPEQYETIFALFLKLAHLMHEITKKFSASEVEQL